MRSPFAIILVAPTSARPPSTPRALCVPAKGSSLPQMAKPGRVDMYVHVCVLGLCPEFVASQIPFIVFCLFRPSAPALQCLGLIMSAGGYPGASVSVVCALRGSLSRPRMVPCCCVCGWCLGGTGCGVMRLWSPVQMHVQRPGWGIAVCCPCSVVGLRWWAGVYRARVCLRWFLAVVSDCLRMPNHVSL